MEEVYAATTFNTRQLFKYFSAFVVIPKHSEKICQPSDTSAKETCSGRVKSEAGSGTWKFASLGRWCNGGIHQQKTIGPWCRAEICKNQAVHYVNRLCSIIILYTVYVYIYIQQIHLDPVLVKYTEGTILLEFWCLWLWGAKKTKGFSGFPITFQWTSSSSNCFNYDQAQQTYRNSVSILNRVAATYSEIMWNLNKRALFRPWRWRTGNP